MEGENKTPQTAEEPEGDYIPYGFGHPAHKPDPNARYGFESGNWRVLPVKDDRRWRVPG